MYTSGSHSHLLHTYVHLKFSIYKNVGKYFKYIGDYCTSRRWAVVSKLPSLTIVSQPGVLYSILAMEWGLWMASQDFFLRNKLDRFWVALIAVETSDTHHHSASIDNNLSPNELHFTGLQRISQAVVRSNYVRIQSEGRTATGNFDCIVFLLFFFLYNFLKISFYF